MTAHPDAYALRPAPIQAQLYLEENRRRNAPAPTLAEISAVGDQRAADRPYLACPDCARDGHPGRLGTRRNGCALCNRFASSVRRSVLRRALDLLTDDERARLRAAAEAEVFARLEEVER